MRKPKNSFEVKKTGKQGLGHVDIIPRLHLLSSISRQPERRKNVGRPMTTWEKTFGRKEKTQLAENLGARSDIKLKTELLAEELGGLCALEEIR